MQHQNRDYGVETGDYIVVTDRSVWLVEVYSSAAYIVDRATFGSPFINPGRQFAGFVSGGKLRPGDRLLSHNTAEETGDFMTGIIIAVYRHPSSGL